MSTVHRSERIGVGRTELPEPIMSSLRAYRAHLIEGNFDQAGMVNLSLTTKVEHERLKSAEFSALTVLAHVAVAYGDREDLTRAIRVYRIYANLGYYSADDLASSLRRPSGHRDPASTDDMLFSLFAYGPDRQFLVDDRRYSDIAIGNHKAVTATLIATMGSDTLAPRLNLIATAKLEEKLDILAGEIDELRRSTG